jgi:hypothetical protein
MRHHDRSKLDMQISEVAATWLVESRAGGFKSWSQAASMTLQLSLSLDIERA